MPALGSKNLLCAQTAGSHDHCHFSLVGVPSNRWGTEMEQGQFQLWPLCNQERAAGPGEETAVQTPLLATWSWHSFLLAESGTYTAARKWQQQCGQCSQLPGPSASPLQVQVALKPQPGSEEARKSGSSTNAAPSCMGNPPLTSDTPPKPPGQCWLELGCSGPQVEKVARYWMKLPGQIHYLSHNKVNPLSLLGLIQRLI